MRESWHATSRPVWIDCCHRVISFSGFQLPPDFDQPSIFTFAELETAVLHTIYYYIRSIGDP